MSMSSNETKIDETNLYIKVHAERTWSPAPNVQAYVCHIHNSHYCGYVELPNCPFKEEKYNGFLMYIPVHGGITYAHPPMYGFDCTHAGDTAELWPIERVVEETNKLANALCLAADGWEQAYLDAETREDKVKVIEAYLDRLGEELVIGDNFGVMLNLLGGRI